MSGLWDWWRRVREPPQADNSDEVADDEEIRRNGDGQEEVEAPKKIIMEEVKEESENEKEASDSEFEDDKEYAEIEELIKAAAEEEAKASNEVSVTPTSEPDYDEVKEVSEPMETAKESERCEVLEPAEEKTDEEQEWSEDELDPAQVPTVKLTLDLRTEECKVVSLEESCTPIYEPAPCLHSAEAKLAPVYATVVKQQVSPNHSNQPSITVEEAPQPEGSDEEDTDSPPTTIVRPLTPVPPPIPPPDWDEGLDKKEVVWRIGKMKKMRKWIGEQTKTNIPNRLSKILSQDFICHQGQSGFEDLRRYIKQGGDFCKELTTILQERAEAEAQYGKTLAKLSTKLIKATKESSGTVNAAWHRIAVEMENQADVHRNFATSLAEEVVRPLKQLVDSQHRIRKSVETAVDKSGKNLAEWRAAESKAKKNSFTCARENEKLRDAGGDQKTRLSTSSLHIPTKITPEKETAKMETKRRKAEECVKKADVEYYTVCLRAERSRLEWESAVLRGSHCFQVLEEERLRSLKDLANSYLSSFTHIGPKITQICDRLSEPIKACDLNRDLETVITLKAATEPSQEQILPDFYPEHTTLAMNRDRRKQALIKLLELIRSDLERERRGKAGVENLAVALKRTPTFASEDSQQNVQDKLHHMRSMLTYLEAARYKVLSVLSELEGRPKPSHPLADHIHVSRDRQGYQQSVLKVPSWIHNEADMTEWVDRGTADGTSVQPDSDFDEFSSQGSEKEYEPVVRISNNEPVKCRALYNYTANLYDELSLNPGDIINIHDKQPDGWWLGELNGTVGIFPATYVEEIK